MIQPNMSAAARRAAIDDIVIENPRATAAHSVFDYLQEHAGLRASKSKRCVLLTGPTQSGKSTILESYVARHNTADSLASGQVPVLHVTLDANVTRKGLAENILEAIEDFGVATGSESGSETALMRRARHYLRILGVKLLILDEFHHLVHSESNKLASSVGETIKRMLIKGVCPIVLSGIEDAKRPFNANHQLTQRSEPCIELKPLNVEQPADAEFFMKFLAGFLIEVERVTGITNARSLFEGDIPEMISETTSGVLGAACNLIKAGVSVATLAGRNHIAIEDLIVATDQNFVATGLYTRNPFRDGLEPIRVDHGGRQP
ncbi:MAG: hypothetical protein JWP35_4458 [Caulobacter sp.]|nr:hypothetical protein [Caulobacter sp.]